ncbi:MAG TPA: altronate dehydratase family protein [Candidatus Angelobacter sp.]|nr:altronate dehydratase family protein [Candidatus Angelobacter sp.]
MSVTIQPFPNVTVTQPRRKFLQIHPKDNVLVALTSLKKGDEGNTAGLAFAVASDVPAKHKFATASLQAGDAIVMYGITIGRAIQPIGQGELITTRNVRHDTAKVERKLATLGWNSPDVSRWRSHTFAGYHRSDGQVGTRNYWLVIPLVFCENRNVAVLKQAFEEELGYAAPQVYRNHVAKLVELYRQGKISDLGRLEIERPEITRQQRKIFSNVDGIKFLTHEGGCGGTRQDSSGLVGLLAGYIHHPNVAGATILSLGCQNAQVEFLRKEIVKRNPNFNKPLVVLEQQQSGSEFAMISQAIQRTFLGLVEADKCTRQPAPLSKLSVALQCGGSDGFSGISANPAIGHTSDLIAALGGTTILSEFPELCGVEQELADRSTSSQVADRFLQLMRDYNTRAQAVGSGFDMNPSPGNIRDGLITDAMKSAGAAKKGGTSPVTAALDFPEYCTEPGLNLLCTPGNDVESVTAQVGGGANVVLFTTGLGTPTGNPIAPVIKISTNSELAQRMNDIIDLDAGAIISGDQSVEETGENILELVSRVASGEVKTKAENLAQDDFIPWKRGVSL